MVANGTSALIINPCLAWWLALALLIFGVTSTHIQAARADAPKPEEQDLYLELETEPRDAFVQAQILLKVRLFRALSLASAVLSEPKIASGDAVIVRLNDDKRYEVWRNGRHYWVVEQRYAIFPQTSGPLRIAPITLEAEILESPRSIFNSLALRGRIRHLQTPPAGLTVKPIPADFTGSYWLPARQLEISETWANTLTPITVGQPITHTLALQANGLTAAQLPELKADLPKGLTQYPEQPNLHDQTAWDGLTATRQQAFVVMAQSPGTYILPEVKIAWWNTATQQPEVASLPARTIEVAPSPAAQVTPAQTIPAPAGTDTPQDLPQGIPSKPNPWQWLSLLLSGGWLFTLLAWWRSQRNTSTQHTPPIPSQASPSTAVRVIKAACQANDPITTKAALMRWARLRWPEQPPASLADLGQRLADPSRSELAVLTRVLYGKDPGAWSGEALWHAIQASLKTPQPVKPKPKPRLETLYKA